MCWGAFVYHDIHSRPRRCCHHWWTSLLRVRGTSSSCFCLVVVTLIIHIQRVCMMNSSCILQETGDISGIKRSSSQLFYYIMSRKCLIKLEIAAKYVRKNPPSSLLFRPEERHFRFHLLTGVINEQFMRDQSCYVRLFSKILNSLPRFCVSALLSAHAEVKRRQNCS